MRVEQSNIYSCLAATAAMVAGTTEQKVFDFIGHDGSTGFPERRPILLGEIAWFLHQRGFRLGICAEPETAARLFTGTDPREFGLGVWVMSKHPAILIVKGFVFNHAVFWTGRQVLDPKRGRSGGYDLDDFKILEWWPVARIANLPTHF